MAGSPYSLPDRVALQPPASRFLLRRFLVPYALPPLSVLWGLIKFVGRIFPATWNQLLFSRFWGEAILSADPYFVIDSYEDVRLRNGFRRAEASLRLPQQENFSGSELIDGTFAPQAAAMLTALFLRHAGKVLRIATDTEVGHKRDAILISYGTSDSNFKTFDIEASSASNLCQFSFDGSGRRAFRVAGQLYGIEHRGGIAYDKAIILRVTSRQNSSHCHVICAGLSEWGSLASVHYLTKKWKTLHTRFDGYGQRRDFCVLLEVPCGQFESARELTSVVRWEPSTSARPNMVLTTHI